MTNIDQSELYTIYHCSDIIISQAVMISVKRTMDLIETEA